MKTIHKTHGASSVRLTSSTSSTSATSVRRLYALWILGLLISGGLGLGACSAVRVYSDIDNSAAFGTYSSFAWVAADDDARSSSAYNSNLIAWRVQQAVNKEMARRGYTIDEQCPDLLIHYHLIVDTKTSYINNYEHRYRPMVGVTIFPPYYFVYDQPLVVRNTRQRMSVKEGTLIIDVIERSSKRHIWRGWAETTLDHAEDVVEELVTGVAAIFKKYPVD